MAYQQRADRRGPNEHEVRLSVVRAKELKAIITPCPHKWERIDKIESSYLVAGNVNEIIYVNRCSLCGEIEKIRIS